MLGVAVVHHLVNIITPIRCRHSGLLERHRQRWHHVVWKVRLLENRCGRRQHRRRRWWRWRCITHIVNRAKMKRLRWKHHRDEINNCANKSCALWDRTGFPVGATGGNCVYKYQRRSSENERDRRLLFRMPPIIYEKRTQWHIAPTDRSEMEDKWTKQTVVPYANHSESRTGPKQTRALESFKHLPIYEGKPHMHVSALCAIPAMPLLFFFWSSHLLTCPIAASLGTTASVLYLTFTPYNLQTTVHRRAAYIGYRHVTPSWDTSKWLSLPQRAAWLYSQGTKRIKKLFLKKRKKFDCFWSRWVSSFIYKKIDSSSPVHNINEHQLHPCVLN